MSNKLQEPKEQENTKSTRSALIVVIGIIIVVTGVYMMRATDNANEALDNAEKVQETEEATDEYKDWQGYSWEGQGVSFKHPKGWITEETASMGRLYVKNVGVDLLKEETPDNFQQVWLSVDTDENSAAREEAIKNGQSSYRVVDGEVKASTIEAGDITINTYEYNTTGGVTLEAYWADKDGKRFYATNSTEVGEQNQKDMVDTLKKLLTSVTVN